MIFKGRKSGINHNSTMTVDPGYKNMENFAVGISWYMMYTNAFFQLLILNQK